jgi:xanthine/uracil permease
MSSTGDSSNPKRDLVYDVDERPRSAAHWLVYSGQWVVTMVYAVVWGYAIVGLGLRFEGPELSAYLGRVVLLVGLSTLFQAWLGHRFAMVSGPNVIPSLALVAALQTGGREYALQGFTAQILAGVVLLVGI